MYDVPPSVTLRSKASNTRLRSVPAPVPLSTDDSVPRAVYANVFVPAVS